MNLNIYVQVQTLAEDQYKKTTSKQNLPANQPLRVLLDELTLELHEQMGLPLQQDNGKLFGFVAYKSNPEESYLNEIKLEQTLAQVGVNDGDMLTISPTICVTVQPNLSQGQVIDLPFNISFENWRGKLRGELRLPVNDSANHQTIIYHLHHLDSGHEIPENRTLEQANVLDGDRLMLSANARAGSVEEVEFVRQ